MEIIGWITIILLCALALTFIVIELGPVIHSEISFWKFRKQKSFEAKEDKIRFKQDMKNLKRKVKKLNYMKKNGLDTSDIDLEMEPPKVNVAYIEEEAIEETIEFNTEEEIVSDDVINQQAEDTAVQSVCADQDSIEETKELDLVDNNEPEIILEESNRANDSISDSNILFVIKEQPKTTKKPRVKRK